MIHSACLIFNPVAGQGDSEHDLDVIRSSLSSIDLDVVLTSKEVTADQLAHDALQRGVEAVIVSGGDGTVSQVAGAMIGSKTPLGVISRGTANAFAKALGIPDTIEAACGMIVAGHTQVVDAATCNGKPMVLLTGVGLEAKAVEQADRKAKDRLGPLAYILAGFKEVLALNRFQAELTTETQTIELEAAAITVANAAAATSVLAQGPDRILPNDGLLDITIVAPETPVGAIAASYELFRTAGERPIEREDVGYLRAKRVKLTTEPPQKVVIDGEMMGTTPIEVECIPQALTIFVHPLSGNV